MLVTGRQQTLGEEIANAISHGSGALAALIALPFLLVHAVSDSRGAPFILAVCLFGLAQMTLYVASTIYHALPHGPAKRVFRVLDHSAIYLLIAGTYSPFALGVFMDTWGWPIFSLVWGLAALGILLKSIGRVAHPLLSSSIYLGMGWLAVLVADPLFDELPRMGLYWLLAGGAAYSLGVIFFVLDDRVRFAHFTWHLFVLGGSICHFLAVLWYA